MSLSQSSSQSNCPNDCDYTPCDETLFFIEESSAANSANEESSPSSWEFDMVAGLIHFMTIFGISHKAMAFLLSHLVYNGVDVPKTVYLFNKT